MLEPATGRLTGADTGKGRLPEPAELFDVARRVLARGTLAADLTGRHVVVSAGGTREALDPVRFLGNRSSGRQGYALAATAVARGARVTLVSANVALPAPAGTAIPVTSAVEMREAVLARLPTPTRSSWLPRSPTSAPTRRPPGRSRRPGPPPTITIGENPDISRN